MSSYRTLADVKLYVITEGKTKAKAQITAWQIKAFSIRKLDRKESAPTAPATEKTQPEEAPF